LQKIKAWERESANRDTLSFMKTQELLIPLKLAAKALRTTSLADRNQVLLTLADLLKQEEKSIFLANIKDLDALSRDANSAFRDRLTLNSKRIEGMQESLRQVAALPDPLGEVVEERTLANGLHTRRVRSPLGVIFMIFESRPNVAIEAFSLALKSGNAIILRGGKESKNTVEVFYALMARALASANVDANAVLGITDPDRAIVLDLLHQKRYIDVVVPRGGDQLIEFVVENSKIPIIKNDRGMCHIYVHSDAKRALITPIIENAKKQRPGVCNAMETLLIHETVAKELLPLIYEKISSGTAPVEWFACEKTFALLKDLPHVQKATAKSFDTEYLELKMNCKIVASVDEAIAHIEAYGSRHSEAILTETKSVARLFQGEVDAAAVYWNASTRFTDGFELGLGGELGISTQKLHVRGPVGLKELTSIRWIMDGSGQIRV
jgi:glutamate-5-semialdehyde dehydrogenase